MRCKNCGWDNPDGNVRCEKCNAQLPDTMSNERMSRDANIPDDFNPRATVANVGTPENSFNVRATIAGCASCGYPVKPGDADCPVCGASIAGNKEVEKPANKVGLSVGTIIQGANFDKDKDKTDAERRKLTGFLITYENTPNGAFFPIYEGKNTIGRDASSHVMIQGDTSVSERHLSILYRTVDRKFKFKDEQSSNGTFVNGELIDEGVLKNGDIIRVGSTRLLFMEIPLTSFE